MGIKSFLYLIFFIIVGAAMLGNDTAWFLLFGAVVIFLIIYSIMEKIDKKKKS